MHHYFGTKDDLFVAALELPVDPREVIAAVVEGGVDGAGERLLRLFLSVWDDPGDAPAAARRWCAGSSSRAGQQLIREGFLRMSCSARSASASASTSPSAGCRWSPAR